MSDQVFPVFPGMVLKERIIGYDTTVQTARSGKEYRLAWRMSPRYRYVWTIDVLRDPLNEAADFANFFMAHRGRWDSFLYDDTFWDTSVQPAPTYLTIRRRVRFDMDDESLAKIVEGLWGGETIELVSLL